MTVNHLNEIISIFIQRNVWELSDHELSTAFETNGETCSDEDIRRIVQSFGASLFQLRLNKDGTYFIKVEPTINICRDFLQGKCFGKSGGCNELHLCRQYGHCTKENCHFPHNLLGRNNRRIVERANCQNIDPILLVPLLRLKRVNHRSPKSSPASPVVQKTTNLVASSTQLKPVQLTFESSRGSRTRYTPRNSISSSVADRDCPTRSVSPSSTFGTNPQLYISFPSKSVAPHINIEAIEEFLSMKELPVQNKFNLLTSKNFHRWTLEFERDDAVDDLMMRPVVPYKDIYLKFKRTNPMIDPKSFVLKSTIDSKSGPILMEEFSNYVDILIDRCPCKLTDLSKPLEQVVLVQCDKIIDFNIVRRIQNSRRQLNGRDVSLKLVYELEKVFIESLHPPLSPDFVRYNIEPVHLNVFVFNIVSNQRAFVEFIHSDALKQWLSTSDITKQRFGINIELKVECVDEDDNVSIRRSAARSLIATQSTNPKVDDAPSPATTYIRQTWALVACHPTFGIKYKNYIRSEIGFEINIRGNRIQMYCAPAPSSSLLNKATNNFMKDFAFRSVSLEQPMEQLNILHERSTTVAFRHVKDNKYMVATYKSDIENLMEKLLPKKSLDKNPVNLRPMVTSAAKETVKPVDKKPPTTFSVPPPLSNWVSIDDKFTESVEIITKSVILPNNSPAQVALVADKIFENRLRTHFEKKYDTKINIELTIGNNGHRMVKLIGRRSSVDEALSQLLTLLSLFRTKKFDETIDSGWIKIIDAARVIQHHFTLHNIICVCEQQISPVSVLVHYIDEKHTEFGVKEQVISTLCRKQLVLSTCTQMLSTRFDKEWMALKATILQRADYGKDICLLDERQIITLFGLPQVVKDLQQEFESINTKDKEFKNLASVTKVQLNPIPLIVKADSNKPEKPPIAKGHIFNIQNSPKFSESATLHERHRVVADVSLEKDRTRSIIFDVDEPGFEVLVNKEFRRLLVIVESKCLLEKQIINHRIQIHIPKAKVIDFGDNTVEEQSQENNSEPLNGASEASANPKTNWFFGLFQRKKPDNQPPKPAQQQSPTLQVRSTSDSNNTTSVTIGLSKIIVCTGDLTKQAVDIIVVCSTSKILCNRITSAAGYQVESVYNQQSSCNVLAFETDSGNLPCKKIVFRPWISDQSQPLILKESIDTFVASAMAYALRNNFTTLAFPSIGCGQLGLDPKLIADHMISETYRQLKIAPQSRLIVSFVLLPEQQNVLHAFTDQLNTIAQPIDDTPASLSFDKQMVKITLTGTNDSDLADCQNKIKELARSCSLKLHLTDQTDMADWPQSTIQKYYEYCLQRRVIPTLNIQNSILDLVGPKDAVSEVEKYFFKLTAETLRHARIQVVSRGFIWSVEVSPGKYEQYSYKVNEQIEGAQRKSHPWVEFINEKSEQCRVIFSTMEEQYQQRKRKVCRRRIDSSLPNNWDLSGGNFKRVALLDSFKEYKDVVNQFDTTMSGSYFKIVRIERIQNERWYKQYAAHRDDFQQRYQQLDERLLFHGCNSTSADKIAQECFNRAYAGVNGTSYGCGVYFHAHAKYSHAFTKLGVSGERTMFLARVLIGKTCIGNSSMKVPPEGFDTTTNGDHIFVVYHDAGAYGEYLITYR